GRRQHGRARRRHHRPRPAGPRVRRGAGTARRQARTRLGRFPTDCEDPPMTPATMTTLPWAVDPGTDPRTGGTPDSGIGIGGPEPVGNADVRPMFGPAAVAELLATARTEVLAM